LPSRFARLDVRAPSTALAERAAAEAFAAGAAGLEERDDGLCLRVYATAAAAPGVAAALAPLAVAGLQVGSLEPVAPVDWSLAWREGLSEVVISPRLAVRPPFAAPRAAAAGRAEVVIDPAQAFGTGHHASTRLALALLDAILPEEACGPALDVGCGSGVLALAALRLGAPSAVALDLDPVATRATLENARRNRLEARVRVFTGTIRALRGSGFAPIAANLLRRELLPIVPELARLLRPGGALVLSGLLAPERAEVEDALAGAGLPVEVARTESEAAGDVWLALQARRAGRGHGDAGS
jgi:ribosomal protein L11 methyltransferase